MITLSDVLCIINLAAAAIVTVHGVFSVINLMGRRTGHGMRIAWVILTVGALGVLLGPIFGKAPPSPSWSIMLAGVALAIVFDRRQPGHLRGMP